MGEFFGDIYIYVYIYILIYILYKVGKPMKHNLPFGDGLCVHTVNVCSFWGCFIVGFPTL